ncbi:MAG: FAD-dependent oxidoreductase [Microgenomates group bacterium]|nr:FAD-dependent oxidoreductase [Microgenomates group bacterium]
MKIAVLGGGITGLTAAYLLAQKNHRVTIFEKEARLGGLAAGFKKPNWDWSVDLTYHHLFANDYEILNFLKEIDFKEIFFQKPITASLYQNKVGDYQIYPLDTPIDFLKFPLLSWQQKIRAGAIIAFLKVSPFFDFYNHKKAKDFLCQTMGEPAWEVLWQELFRKKFGKYAGNILTSFFWARIKKRTKSLGYIKGGFQALVDFIEKKCQQAGVEIVKNFEIKRIEKRNNIYNVYYNNKKFEAIISTLPSAILTKVAKNIFPSAYLSRLKKIKYLHNISLILESEKPLLDKTYWLNICVREVPFTVIVQQTNFIDKKFYGDKHLIYVGNYVDDDSPLLNLSADKIFNYYFPYLNKINKNFNKKLNFYVYKTLFAQPIFNRDFVNNKPETVTPAKNFFISNLDLTYPYDRGTNFAVLIGKKISQLV